MTLRIDHERGRASFLAQLEALSGYLAALDDAALLADSRCLGWVVGDVITHVHLGLQEMFLGLASPTADEPDRDAASYWHTQPPSPGLGPDELAHIRYVRLLFSGLRRPSSLLEQWAATTAALTRLVARAAPGVLSFQSYRLTTGDFLASWAVELSVHHLDLRPDHSPLPSPAPASDALLLARRTIEALLGVELPAQWSDEYVVLVGTGRSALTTERRGDLGATADQLPVLG